MAFILSAEVAVVIVCLSLDLLLFIPFIKALYTRCTSKENSFDQAGPYYQDEDGVATEESQNAYSDIIQRLILLLSSIFGVTLSLIFVIATYLDRKARCSSHNSECDDLDNLVLIDQVLTLPAWGLLLAQTSLLFRTRSPTKKYYLGIYGAVATLILAVSSLQQAATWRFNQHSPPATRFHYTIVLVQFLLAVLSTITFLLIPRRPDVFNKGHIVDQQFTVSLVNRATFAWATPLLTKVANLTKLDYSDLPVISDDARAQTLSKNFSDVGKSDRVWKTIFWSNKSAFYLQWILSFFQSFSNFFPQVALYFALRFLEDRDAGKDRNFQLWLLVLILGLSNAAQNWLESGMFFVCYIKLGVPIYEQLAAVIFRKSIRKKDVKGVSSKTAVEQSNEDTLINEASGPKDEDTTLEEGDDDDVAKTKQSTINLIGVDGKRIADFATYNCMILGSSLKIVIAVCFLVSLVGWIPMLSGFAAFAALMPLNWWITSSYSEAQDTLMKRRDAKMGVVAEALQGIRQIKFSALEDEWDKKIGQSRSNELSTLWRAFRLDTALLSCWIFGPVALSAISLTTYALIYKQLTASVAFTTISIFEAIEVTLAVVPELITELFDALVSSGRIQEYLDSPDQEQVIVPGDSIRFRDATVSWPTDQSKKQDEVFKLRNLNLDFPTGQLSVISGKTGSGKSLLLSAIIGEADVLQGSVTAPRAPSLAERFDQKANKSNWSIPAAIAYVSQIPWIENAAIRDNILFGLPTDEGRYQAVLKAAALTKDLEMLADHDLTDIGANGINLSGGQKWRISFARALYSRAGTLILDDIFSAVDAHVGKHLYEEALTGELCKDRTRILVTHHVALCLPRTKYSVLLENGTVLQAGPTEKLRRSGHLKTLLSYDIEEQLKQQEEAEMAASAAIDDGGSLQRLRSHQSAKLRRQSALSEVSVSLTRTKSNRFEELPPKNKPKKFTEDENREKGAIKLSIYQEYIRASGGLKYWSIIFFVFLLWTATFISRPYWISIWTRSYGTESNSAQPIILQSQHMFQRLRSEFRAVEVEKSLSFYLAVYMAIAVSSWLLGTLKYFCVYAASIRASKQLFENLSYAVLRAPLRFLDTTPTGRILNRFTADFNAIDSNLASDLGFTIHSGISSLAVVVAGVFVSPFMLIASIVLMLICLWYATRYLAGAREVKRLESNAKSPVFEQFGSVLTGIGTIRAFGKTDAYIERMEAKIDVHCQAYYHLWLFTRWMGLRIAFVGAIFLTAMGALIVGIPNIDAPLAGFALSFSLQLSDAIMWMLRQYASLELDMNAVERVVEYAKMPIEDQGGMEVPAAWPTKGEVEVNDLVVSYAQDLTPVLQGLSFSVKQNERIGVVGRTGAGKSSLTLALFRFLEARSGSIHIDGIDISKIKLIDLRSRLAIIPQDPVLFSGTIRSNLDAFDQHSDTELRDALARVHLASSSSAAQSGVATPIRSSNDYDDQESTTNRNLFTSLRSKISEGGLNLSQGQRQLLCLARAIVSRPKIMVLDEATSSVDMDTDALIQRSIREEFADSTLIVIAHRLSTIADFDRILVLGEGKVLEFDTPSALMEKENGVFRGMVGESGEKRELEAIIRGGGD